MPNAAERDDVEQQLTTVAEALSLPSSTAQITRVRLNQLGSEPEIEDSSLSIVGATTLSLSAREDGLPITVSDVAEAWSETLEGTSIDPGAMTALFDDIAANLDIDGVPPEPRALIERFGTELDLPDGIVVVAKRILEDAFEADPQTIAGSTSPAGTAGAVLYLAAAVNDVDGADEDALGDVTDTSQVTVRNRYKELRDLLGEQHLETTQRYQLDPDTGAPMATSSAPDTESAPVETADDETSGEDPEATDKASADVPGEGEPGTADADDESTLAAETAEVVTALFPDELPTTDRVAEELAADPEAIAADLETLVADGTVERKRAGSTDVWLPGDRDALGPDLTEDAVQREVDAIADELDLDASVRLFARGLVSDVVEAVDVEHAGELGGAALLAACRVNDVDVEASEIAATGEFAARALYDWLETLDSAVDIEIPTAGAETYVDRLADVLDLDESVREESVRAIEQYDPRPDDPSYTPPELAAGATVFAATVRGTGVELEQLAEASGADPAFVSEATDSVLVSLCLDLVREDLDYEETGWTGDLLESELSPEFGDSETGAAIALAKAYAAGRESQPVDEATIDALVGR
ncbi:Transcription initiation factor TFIIB, Brf1 subunit/Transcription initiation factor TFIIB [Halapricum desulfuricans]|uniref:Transcription initiation factor TFIIB, Brf1 subunit/Transcription initiation factor TFIIB n=1 Tax=Halapricum desulfuricans TaxID=2841257 RepID=A0A897NNM9_9EURY|nr:hypothetical protein [Halapricum desulfuricans]QSG12513.1 Transcription initiation factor TFIIB, Brf1 subunit/Transcription initiation factor TFIIB [Halapricum desulfuricans]